MKANEVALNDFLSQTKTQFVIPVYQRNYDWTEEQCKQLLYDILEIGNKTVGVHFIGSIVFIHDGVYTSSEVKQLVVIDGQQRLTTFSLLYLALHRFAQENDMQEKAEEIKDTFITNKYVKEEGSKMKLKQSDNNASAFKFLMSGEDIKQYKEFSRVVNNFSYFKQNISASTFETILNGLNRLIFVEISLERGKDDPQRIFESINSTGLELSQADLIRNYILMGLEPRDQERIFESYWNVIENKTKHIDTEQRRVSDFIRDFLTYKTKKIPNRNAVYEEFKSRYANRDNRFYGETLQEIKEYSYYYDKLINSQHEHDADVRKELNYLNRLEIQVAFPFLLPVYNDYSKNVISKEVFISVLRLIQSFAWRRIMINMPASALNKIFLALYNDIQPHSYLESLQRSLVKKKGTSRIPNNQEIDTALTERDVYTMQAKNRIYFLEQLENYQNREFVSIDNPNLTIEHIFPQNPSAKWEEELSEQEFTLFQEKYLNTIANLTLSGNNGSLSNKSFQEKKHMNSQGKEQGYLYSNLRMNAMLKEIDGWNEENYLKRLAWIQERFKKIWPYPEVELASENEEEDEDYNIFEVTDARFKKLDYFIFRDEKVVTKEIANMYQHVINILYHENPVLFGHPDVAGIIQLTADRNLLRSAKELGSTFFYESNIDNNNKLERLRRLLIRFNSEDDLLLNFSNRSEDNEQIHVDRSFWESKANSDALNILDGCFQLFKEIDSEMSLNYVQSYVGLLKNGKAYNCTLFQPTSSYVRTRVYVENPSEWITQLQNAGVSSNVALGKNGRIRIRISKENFTFHRELLRRLFEASYNRWSEE
jgi:uncharacterized protein with ParB-like and HNH nuclease domain